MKTNTESRIFVLDTNVLMHDPTALFRFKEHDVFIPMVVLEELDGGKKGTSEVARNARQSSRFIDELIDNRDSKSIAEGLVINEISPLNIEDEIRGRLFLQTEILTESLTFCHLAAFIGLYIFSRHCS
jgi:PhoH-like ATPase